MGQLSVGGKCTDLQDDSEGQIADIDVGERPDLVAVAGHDRQDHVEEEQEDQEGADAEPHVAAHEGPSMPPAVPLGAACRFSSRPVCRRGLHHSHVGTARPLGPAMLSTCQTPRSSTRAVGATRRRS